MPWNMGSLIGAELKNADSLSPGIHQLLIALELGLCKLLLNHAAVWAGLLLCRSYTQGHSPCEFTRATPQSCS